MRLRKFHGCPTLRRGRLFTSVASVPLFGLLLLAGCHRDRFPTYAPDYREFAYVSNGVSGTVTVLDLVNLRQDRTVQVGKQPTGLAANPKRNEVYAVNTGSDSVSVIDAQTNTVVHTIGVHHMPYFISVAPDGKRAYVANAGSNSVSVLDLDARREIGVAGTGEQPGLAVVSPDNRAVVVANRAAGSVSVYSVNTTTGAQPLQFREAFTGCPGPTDIAILPDATKAFIACSGSDKVMVVWLGQPADSWYGRNTPNLQHDHLLSLLKVGDTPVALAMQSSGDEVFSLNFRSNSVSEIRTWTNEVLGTYALFQQPTHAVISHDNSSLWVTNFGSDAVGIYSVDDDRMEGGVRTGSRPDALAFSADEHLLLVADSGSANVAVVRVHDTAGPTLFTMLPSGPQPNDLVIKAFRVH